MAAHDLAEYALSTKLDDASTAETVFLTVPFGGTLKAVYTALEGAISGADADVVVTANGVAAGTITIANSGSAAGDVDSIACAVPVPAGSVLKFAGDGASTGAQSVGIVAVIDRSD